MLIQPNIVSDTNCVVTAAVSLQAREVLGAAPAADAAAAGSQPALQATTEAAASSREEAGAGRPYHTRSYSFFQPFQSGMQQARLSCPLPWPSNQNLLYPCMYYESAPCRSDDKDGH